MATDPMVTNKMKPAYTPSVATPGPLYEYSCHEGNYAMEDILGGAREAEAEGPRK